MIDKEQLYKLYWKENKTTQEIGDILGVSKRAVNRYLHLYDIDIKPTGNYKNKEYHQVPHNKQYVVDDDLLTILYNEYKPIKEISETLGVCIQATKRRIKELGLERNKNKMMSREQYDPSNDELIVKLYKEGKSTTQIGYIVGLKHTAVNDHLRRNGVHPRTLSKSQFAYNNKNYPKELDSYETMYDLYIVNRMTKKDIGDMLNVSPSLIDRTLKKLGIRVRGNSEARKGLFIGSSAWNYKDGRTPLYVRLRTYFRLWQARDVTKRDHRMCQLCGSKKNLQVHHIVPFKDIFDDILSHNPSLDVVRDADRLYEIATNDEKLNDMSNLITYCKDCHLFKIHGYKKKIDYND